MASSKLSTRLSKLLLEGGATLRTTWSSRPFVTAATRPLQAKSDKEIEETCEKVTQAADAVKEGAKEVRKTTEFVRDMASSTAKNVTKMTKAVTEKVSDTAETITEKAIEATTEAIKDKVAGKKS
ncbi:hypothetical protein L1049_017274 [Liquidambar formosana]|uniref:Uncharacterized protein n=1 Tax=Liquidambar formosana TaxID=63359 RepID=A0AAP0S2U9_LIQFO